MVTLFDTPNFIWVKGDCNKRFAPGLDDGGHKTLFGQDCYLSRVASSIQVEPRKESHRLECTTAFAISNSPK
jgi:hypothetical protein